MPQSFSRRKVMVVDRLCADVGRFLRVKVSFDRVCILVVLS